MCNITTVVAAWTIWTASS